MPAPIKLGDVTIQQVVEQEGPFFDILAFFPTLTKELLEENRAWMQPTFMSAQNQIVLCIQSYLVQTPQHNILIDTCVGNHKPRPARPFWNMMNSDRYQSGLAGTGLAVGEIDYVMCTHLHVDHVGWNTRLDDGAGCRPSPTHATSLQSVSLRIGRSATKTIRRHVPGLLIPCCRSWRLTASTS